MTQVMGCSIQKGAGEKYRGVEMDVTVLPKVKVEVIVGNIPVRKSSKQHPRHCIQDMSVMVRSCIQRAESSKVRTGEEDLEALKM